MASHEEKICCPQCTWEPDGNAHWNCTCGTCWNTFETYGKCPSCGKIWKDTQCPKCGAWSPHADWYLDLPAIEIAEEKMSEAN